ncbi:PP2C family protein-serine/threonine phosphatase [Streptomyces sp. Ru71]|uniref:PP2C family protein-serine/threonine phosphatase n=1 Tax=Streptomyces sp. Ru71 TaxID=2080746 RepID=UPI0021565F86|nr:PP2C family protein-serine/threonine phosphatase [Streptomyces sp. Ru71]
MNGPERASTAEVPLDALRTALTRIGTTLDADLTRAELTRAATSLTGCTAAVVRVAGPTVSGYEAISGDPDALPDIRPITEAVRDGVPGGPWTLATGGGRTALCLPLATPGRLYGVLVCARPNPPLTPREAELLALLAAPAGPHLHHADEHARVSGTVGDLQRALLAEPGRPHPNLDVAVRYLPAGRRALVGGDWCETVRLPFGRTLLVVGDVMGHGVEAAVDMAAYRSSLRTITATDLPPHRVLRQMDDLAAGEPDRRPATCLIARVDPGRGQVTLAGAGHLPPVVIDADAGTRLLPLPVGPPLGTGLGGYESATYDLDTSHTLLLFTDGLVERRGEDIDRGLDRLAGLRFPAAAGLEDILDTVLTGLDAHHADDNVAALAARPRARGEEEEPR